MKGSTSIYTQLYTKWQYRETQKIIVISTSNSRDGAYHYNMISW